MNAVEVTLNNKFTDQIWSKVKIQKGEDLLIGVCYRSPSIEISDQRNNDMLCELTEEVRGRPLLLMGDFNYPNIDWLTSHGQTRDSQKFLNSVEENFWTQHVTEGTCNRALLDLVFTSDPDMTDSVSVLSKLGNSDHNMLQWNVQLSPATSLFNHPGLDYSHADYSAIRDILTETDWMLTLQGDANEQWRMFHIVCLRVLRISMYLGRN